MSCQLFHLAVRFNSKIWEPIPSSQSTFTDICSFDTWYCPVQKIQKNGHYLTIKKKKTHGRKVILLERDTLKVKIHIFCPQTHHAHFHFKLNGDQWKHFIILKPLAMASTFPFYPRWSFRFLRQSYIDSPARPWTQGPPHLQFSNARTEPPGWVDTVWRTSTKNGI